MTTLAATRVRYPLKAKLAVLAASVGFLAELALLALCMMPLIPLVPVFIAIMLGNAFVLAEVVHWAASQGIRERVRVPSGDQAKSSHPRGAQEAHAA
jgi:hypothetical protein